MSTRPYSLMLFFLVASLATLFAYFKNKSNLALISFFLMSILASLSHYSSFVVISFCLLILGIFVFTKKLSKSLFLLSSIAFISIQFFQLSQLLKNDTLSSLTGSASPGYIQSYFLNNYEEFFQYSKKFFSIFFFPSDFIFNPTLITVVGLLFFFGLVILLYRKHYFAFMISIVPLIFAVLLACLKLYPFDYFRHSIYLLPCVLVAFLAFCT